MLWHAFHYQTGDPVEVRIVEEKVHVKVTPSLKGEGRKSPAGSDSSFVLTPGLIDLQINGFVGVDFNRPDQLADGDIAKVIAAQHALGVTHILPTVTTNSLEHITEALK